MKSELKELIITEKELETITGFEVNEVFIGGVLGGVYRTAIFKNPKKLLSFCLTEIIVSVLVFVFTLPIGLSATRNSATGINDIPRILQFLQINLGITLIVIVIWNLYMWLRNKRLRILMHLLDEIDRYNEVIQAIDILDRLKAVGNSQVDLINRNDVLEALRVTRDSLVCGLMSEKILRESRNLLARRYDLLANIENNLVTLRTMEVNNQAQEYGQLLNEALQIGMSVHKEVKKLSRFPIN
ncbi:MAG: hypothetical protein KME08_12610 [Aphanothece sp. CMT-3BRIN-NPC111]|jgi:hypothetical protein|nr:hypothetical protein [Aphanothece sp. CMT-3BRIN-NPC111]